MIRVAGLALGLRFESGLALESAKVGARMHDRQKAFAATLQGQCDAVTISVHVGD